MKNCGIVVVPTLILLLSILAIIKAENILEYISCIVGIAFSGISFFLIYNNMYKKVNVGYQLCSVYYIVMLALFILSRYNIIGMKVNIFFLSLTIGVALLMLEFFTKRK